MCGSLGTADAADGREHETAAVEQRLFAGGGDGEQLVPGRQADRAHERPAGDAHAGQVGGGGPAVGDGPVDLERIGELVAEEPEPGDLGGVAVARRFDVDDLDVEQIARLGPFDVDGAGQRVESIEVHPGDSLQRDPGAQLPVERVACLEDHLIARFASDDGGDVGVPAVVAGGGLLDEALAAVDADLERASWCSSGSSSVGQQLLAAVDVVGSRRGSWS